MYNIQMNLSKKLWIGAILCLVIISFVVYSYISNHNTSETTKNTVVIQSNETQVTAHIHHYQVKVNELVNLGERTR